MAKVTPLNTETMSALTGKAKRRLKRLGKKKSVRYGAKIRRGHR